jgi:hypothetical protein
MRIAFHAGFRIDVVRQFDDGRNIPGLDLPDYEPAAGPGKFITISHG